MTSSRWDWVSVWKPLVLKIQGALLGDAPQDEGQRTRRFPTGNVRDP